MTVTYLLGGDIQLGAAIEASRGTAVTPVVWFPARKPATTMAKVSVATIKESRGSGMVSEGTEVITSGAEGDIELNIRNTSIGYILLSLLGSVSTAVPVLGAYTHTFSKLTTSPQNPSLALALAQTGQQHYEYPLTIVDGLDITVGTNDLVYATAKFASKCENTHADYTPAFVETNDNYFRPQDVKIKFASTVAGLGAATAIDSNALKLSFNTNAKPHQNLGSTAYSDILTTPMSISGSLEADYEGAATYYTSFTGNTSKAMGIYFERTDLPVLGTSTLYPKMSFEFPKVTFNNYKPNRSLDDVVKEGVDFEVHYSASDTYAVKAFLQNVKTSYAS